MMMSKGFIETIERMWKDKNDEIDRLNDKIFTREIHIEILANEIIKLTNFKCIHEPGEYERGHRYCDDKCPLVKMAESSYTIRNDNYTIGLSILCGRKKKWSK